MAKWFYDRDGFTAEWIDRGKHLPALIRVTGDRLPSPMEFNSNGEDAITQFNAAIDTAIRAAVPRCECGGPCHKCLGKCACLTHCHKGVR